MKNIFKDKIFNKYFKHEAYLIESYSERIVSLDNENYLLKEQNRKLDLFKKNFIHSINNYDVILGIAENKRHNQFFVVCNSDDDELNIYI